MVTKKVKNILFLVLGFISLLLGVIGIFLPILPTTPFILLSAYLFSKSSKKYHDWLISHKRLGPMITDWERDGVIRTKSKVIAITLITILFSSSIYFMKAHDYLKLLMVFVGLCVSLFIATRPSTPRSF